MNLKLLPFTLSILFILVTTSGLAQDYDLKTTQQEYVHESIDSIVTIRRNSVYAGILSINYSRMISGEKQMFTVGGGLSFAPAAFDFGGVGLMAETTLLTGGKKHFFEPGLLVYFDADIIAPMVRAGYHYQDPEGYLFRAGILFTYMDGFTLLPALSIGYSF